ncbi:ABC transporter permease, partial [Klebsiella pneumoniae]
MLGQVGPSMGVALVVWAVAVRSVLAVGVMSGVGSPAMLTVDMAFRVNSYGDYGVANGLGVVWLASCG